MTVKPSHSASFEFSASVIVIGAGACGLSAAIAAAERGASVLILERDESPTGSTSLSAGLIPAAGTRFQKEAGVDDSADTFFDDIMRKSKGKTDPVMARTIAEQSAATVEWLADKGVEMHLVTDFLLPGHSRHRLHGPPNQAGVELENALLAAAANAGADIVTSATAEILYADDDGRVTAVAFRRPDDALETVGCDAVVLACNGFGGNPEMVKQYIPEMAGAEFFGHVGNKGDALAWGIALGAAVADIGSYQGHASVAHPHGVLLTWSVISEGGIQVNAEGVRFSNELKGYSEQTVDVIHQPGGVAWNIYDERSENPALGFQDYRELIESGAIRTAGTIEELAQVTGLPLRQLSATLDHVAALASGNGEDEFGRDFTQKPALKPPYKAARVTGGLFHTQGGLVIDTTARVVGTNGKPLPNLFAGGGAARGISGPSSWYLAGNGLVTATVFGRLAGISAAAVAG
jgi:fumarate reductase flavoprotein subunit